MENRHKKMLPEQSYCFDISNGIRSAAGTAVEVRRTGEMRPVFEIFQQGD